ncbi:uncharacterized protein [Diabrotica undecimpunctata]|uniref:uncharacterized protein n=1 Tax=Diabrotica undecimpunctata TaxID=50387 RepID=UPI003B635D52
MISWDVLLSCWKPINDRIMTARFYTRYRKITVIQCYAPTNTSLHEEKDIFYEQLEQTTQQVNQGDILIVMGDMNAKVGEDNINLETVMGKHGLGMMNENGERFTNFCSSHSLVIGGTIFPHKNIHKVTWTAPGHTRENQIDHIAISKRWRSSLLDVRNKRGADIASDHHLVIGTIKIKMAKNKTTRNTKRPTYNLDKLKTVPGRHMFREELQLKTREREINSWEDFADVLTEIAEDKLGKKEKDRKEWISDETWNLIEERKQRKKDILQARTVERRAHRQQEYQTINKSVKRKARRDKRRWAEELAKQAETAAQHNRTRELYQITRRLTQKGSNCSNIVRSKQANCLLQQMTK